LAVTIDHSRRFARGLGGLLAAAFLAWLAPPAAAVEVFTIADVAVAAEGATAEQARTLALEQGQVEAFRRLLQRLVAAEDLPGAPALTPVEVQPLIASFEVAGESIKAQSYAGRITFRFEPEAVRSLLAARGLRFTEAQSRPVVVVPVLGDGAEARLWDDPNPWRLAWADHWTEQGLVTLVVPLGELQDIAAADAPEALAGDEQALGALGAPYGAGGVLVVQALPSGDAAAGNAALAIKGRSFGATPLESFSLELAQQAGEDEAALYARAVAAVVTRVEDDWKRANAIYYGTQSNLPLVVHIGALQDWLLTKRVLDDSPLVISTAVLGLSQTRADIVVVHRGTVDQLQRALAQHDLVLQQGLEGWELRIGGAAGQLQAKPLRRP